MTAVAVREEKFLPLAPVEGWEDQFCREYLACGENGTRAYLRVKPHVSPVTARTEASRLLAKPNVQEHLYHLRQEMLSARRLTAEQIMEDVENLLHADQGELWEVLPGGYLKLRPLDELTPAQRKAIQEVTVERTKEGLRQRVRLYSRLDAAKLLLQLHGKLTQVHRHEGEVTHRVMALPAQQPSEEEWRRQYAPRLSAGPKRSVQQTEDDE